MYSEKVIEHFMCPQNFYSIPDANSQGAFGDPACGDALTIFLKVHDNLIQEISYLVYGCCASIATSSMTSVLAKGKSLEDALAITEEDVIQALEGLPDSELVQLKLNIESSVGDSTPTEAEPGVPLPLVEVGVLRLDKVHCSNLGVSALHNAINNYYETMKTSVKEDSQ